MGQFLTSLTAFVIACVALYTAVKIGNRVEHINQKLSATNSERPPVPEETEEEDNP